MAEEVVSSFPFEEWANEVRNALLGRGVDAEVGYEGPRAYPVYIDERDSERAAGVLSEVGYFACATNGPRASLGSAFDWYPMDEDEIDELRRTLEKEIEETVEVHANIRAAEGWSTPQDDEEHILIVATFGDVTAVNGTMGPADIPKGYIYRDGGGRIPSSEQEVELEHVFQAIKQRDEFVKIPGVIIDKLLEEIRQKNYGGRQFAYASVSGEADYYEKEKADGGD